MPSPNEFYEYLVEELKREIPDFDINNPMDSLRIQQYVLSANNLDTDLPLENTYRVINDVDEKDFNPLHFLNSQTSLAQVSDKQKNELMKAAMTGNMILRTKDSLEAEDRIIYIDKNGRARVTPPLSKIKTISQIGEEMANDPLHNKDYCDIRRKSPKTPEEQERMDKLERERYAEYLHEFVPLMENAVDTMIRYSLYESTRANIVFQVDLHKPQPRHEQIYKENHEIVADDVETSYAEKMQIGKELDKRTNRTLWEHKVQKDYKDHPEFYQTPELAEARGKEITNRVYKPSSEAANIFSVATGMEDTLSENGLDFFQLLKDGSLVDKDGKAFENGEYPWSIMTNAAKHITDNGAAFIVDNDAKTIRPFVLSNKELKLRKNIEYKENAYRKGYLEVLENISAQLDATGKAKNESQDYLNVVNFSKNTQKLLKDLNQAKTFPEREIAYYKYSMSMEKLAKAAAKYCQGKNPETLSEPKKKRFDAINELVSVAKCEKEGKQSSLDREFIAFSKKVRETYNKLQKIVVNGEPLFTEEEKEGLIQRAIANKPMLDQQQKNTAIVKKMVGQPLLDEMENIQEKNGIVFNFPTERILPMGIDMTGTPEAEQANIEFLQNMSNEEKFKDFVGMSLDVCRNFSVDTIRNLGSRDYEKILFDGDLRRTISTVFVGEDIVKMAKKYNIPVSPEEEDLIRYNVKMVSSLYFNAIQYQRIFDDETAKYIDLTSDVMQNKIVNALYPYGVPNDTAEESFLSNIAVANSQTSQREVKDSIAFDDILTQNNLLKNSYLIEKFKDKNGNGVFKAQNRDGETMIIPFFDGEGKCFKPQKIKYVNDYPETVDELRNAFEQYKEMINATGFEKENPALFRQYSQQLNAISESLNVDKKTKPEALERLTSKAHKDLATLSKQTQQDFEAGKIPMHSKAAADFFALNEGCAGLIDSAKYLRDRQYENLNYQKNFTNVEAMLREAGIDTSNKLDSLRIKEFILFADKDDTLRKMEETDCFIKSVNGINNAYDLLNSQIPFKDIDNRAKMDLFAAIKNGDMMILPKDMDESKMRFIYYGTDNKAHLTPPIDEIPNLSTVVGEMTGDKVKYPDFPRYNSKSFDDDGAIKAEREKQATVVLKQKLEKMFPKMENPMGFVQKISEYQYAKGNIQNSPYGSKINQPEKVAEKIRIDKMIQRSWEKNVLVDNQKHPNFYSNEQDANERGKEIYNNCKAAYIENDMERAAIEGHFAQHPLFECENIYNAFPGRDIANEVKSGNVLDENGEPIKVAGGKPWSEAESITKAIINEERTLYIKNQNNEVRAIKLDKGEVSISNPISNPDREYIERVKDELLNIKNQLDENGDTRRDSQEYKDLRKTLNDTITKMTLAAENPPSPKSIIAAQTYKQDLAKMSSLANDYFVAKADQSMNARRAKRFDLCSKLRHFGRLVGERKSVDLNMPSMTTRIKEAIAVKTMKNLSKKANENGIANLYTGGTEIFKDNDKLQKTIDGYLNSSNFKEYVTEQGEMNERQYAEVLLKKLKTVKEIKVPKEQLGNNNPHRENQFGANVLG